MAIQTTFSMFQDLLKEAIDGDASLTATMKSALKLRVDALPRMEPVELTAQNVDSTTNATVVPATNSILIPDTMGGTIEWDFMTFSTPVRIDGTIGAIGVLLGHTGQGANPAVVEADITLQYRTTATGVYQTFDRTVVIPETSGLQIMATIATQTLDHDMPQLHILAEQL